MMNREDALRAQRDDVHAALMPNLPRVLLEAAARALGMATEQGELFYRDTNQMAVCTDLALYGIPEGRTLLYAYVRGRAELDGALQEAMPAAEHMLFQVGPADEAGCVPCVPVHEGGPFQLYDPQLAQAGMAGLFVSAYVLPLPGVRITTGAPLAIHPDIVEKVRTRTDLRDARLAASLARTQWSYVPTRPTSGSRQKVRPRAPCPCGSGKRYKNCHGRS